jgi:hypothetical protein
VPGVTLINFTSVDGIVVNGNPPTATETDTLTFAGTNAVDTFNINLAAAGTSADPILRLANQNPTTLLTRTVLTLENYTNFNTLRVLGLDGADTFNVFTADIGERPQSVRGRRRAHGQEEGHRQSEHLLYPVATQHRSECGDSRSGCRYRNLGI